MGWLLVVEVVGGFLATALQFLETAAKNVPIKHRPLFARTFNHLLDAAEGCVDLVVAESGAHPPPPRKRPRMKENY